MKIYLADTIQRDEFDLNNRFPVENHLESYWALISKKKRIEDFSITDRIKEQRK